MSALRVLPVLRLLRIGTIFSPAADVAASVAVLGLAWDGTCARAVVASACLYAAGMALNDLVDRRRDAASRPERPLVRGDLSPGLAFGITALLFAAGLLVSPCRVWHGAIAALVIAYDLVLRRREWSAAVTMGCLRGMNLATALALAPAAVLEGPAATALGTAALCYGAYIAAVTVLGCLEDEEKVPARVVAALLAVPPLATLFAVFTVQAGWWPAPVVAAIPVVWFARQNTRRSTFDRATLRVRMTTLLLGTLVFDALLCVAAGRWLEAALILAAVVPARRIARAISLT